MEWMTESINWMHDWLPDLQEGDLLEGLSRKLGDASELLKDAKKSVKEAKEVTGSDFLGIPLWDNDIYKLLFRFGLNLSVLLVIVRLIYYPIAKRKDYLFTYIMISILTFTICFVLKKFEMEMGMAMGLFAIFGIIRYRTDPIPIKEMTYLFIVIGLSVINALVNKQMSIPELLFLNGAAIVATYGMERLWLLKHESRKIITYEKIDLIKPENEHQLIADLEKRTGLNINRVQIGKIDFLRDTAQIFVYYYQDEQSGHFKDEGISSN